jgi:hypothetical protein
MKLITVKLIARGSGINEILKKDGSIESSESSGINSDD